MPGRRVVVADNDRGALELVLTDLSLEGHDIVGAAVLALRPSVWSPVIFPPRHMLISPAAVCCTSCILSLRVTALPCALLAPMDRCVIYCEPRGSTKKSTDSIALRRWTVYYGPIVEGASC